MKSVQIGSFFWSVFSSLRTEYGSEKTLYLDTFDAVGTPELNSSKEELVECPSYKFINSIYRKPGFSGICTNLIIFNKLLTKMA